MKALILFQKIYMKNIKILFFTILLTLLGVDMQAHISYFDSASHSNSNALYGDGVIHIVQGRSSIRVEATANSPVKLILMDSKQNVRFEVPVIPKGGRININTKNYESGAYTLVAESLTNRQEIDFVIGKK